MHMPALEYAPARRAVAIVRATARTYREYGCQHKAASLTYTTLFALVPLMTVAYSVASLTPALEPAAMAVQEWIFEHFLPETGYAIQDTLGSFAQQARNLTVLGVFFLFVTAFSMLFTLENIFNSLWPDARRRDLRTRFLVYWATLTLGPLLVGGAFALSSYLMSLKLLSNQAVSLASSLGLLQMVPLAINALGFSLLYFLVPSAPVRFRRALIVGLVVATTFALARMGFATFIASFPSYQFIYGAFAAVPLFLLWVYLSWSLILIGASALRAWDDAGSSGNPAAGQAAEPDTGGTDV